MHNFSITSYKELIRRMKMRFIHLNNIYKVKLFGGRVEGKKRFLQKKYKKKVVIKMMIEVNKLLNQIENNLMSSYKSSIINLC